MTNLNELKVPELQQCYAEVVGEPTRCPNKKYLIKKINEARAAMEAAKPPIDEPKTDDRDCTFAQSPQNLASLTVPELQGHHLAKFGRPTRSTNRIYLLNKLRKAEKGSMPIGPRKNAQREVFKVLPLRLPVELIATLDQARVKRGLKSRMELFRQALQTWLDQQNS